MDFIFTVDPYTLIVYQTEDIVIYYAILSSESWVIYGKCKLIGDCLKGAINPDFRPYKERLDIPTRPYEDNKAGNCMLRGEYC